MPLKPVGTCTNMDEWVVTQYRQAYCSDDGRLIASKIDLDTFRKDLKSQRPEEVNEVTNAVMRLDRRICADLCRDLPIDSEGRFLDEELACNRLQEVRVDLKHGKKRRAIVRRIEEDNVIACKLQPQSDESTRSQTEEGILIVPSANSNDEVSPSADETMEEISETELYGWIKDQYLNAAFPRSGFIGWKKFRNALVKQRPQLKGQIIAAIAYLRESGHEFSLEHPEVIDQAASSARKREGGAEISKSQPTKNPNGQPTSKKAPKVQAGSMNSACMTSDKAAETSSLAPKVSVKPSKAKSSVVQRADGETAAKPAKLTGNAVTHKLQHFHIADSSSETAVSSRASSFSLGTPRASTPDFTKYSQLLTGKKKSTATKTAIEGTEREIEQAPLLSGSVILQHSQDLVPQFGLLGCLAGQDASQSSSQIFLNTNVPMSTFICGVQGSGKSHTTSCILENAVIPSPHLGQLEKPVSTLVFSYGEWSNGGAGFNISEATYLGAPSKVFPGHQVKRITVLTSPSNLAIKRLYQRHPNVRIIPFRLRAKTLDISALRTLMAVDEKSYVPLYMAKVESILRSIAAKSKDGSLDYAKFKQLLKGESFNPDQTNMLEMRLDLLESFLDLTDAAPQPDYLPGEITIMDLSDAFITPSTACILFKLGLEHFLQRGTPGKLVVLDEAHKYMLNTPGSKVLTESLKRIIRLQRHQGARVVISTQEPTISTDLIALCSLTIIHRFTSPAWYSALKQHINAMDDDQRIMHDIEGLETGEAFVYAPNAVLGKEDGVLVKATGRLLKLNIRNRVTLDGGESIMAV